MIARTSIKPLVISIQLLNRRGTPTRAAALLIIEDMGVSIPSTESTSIENRDLFKNYFPGFSFSISWYQLSTDW